MTIEAGQQLSHYRLIEKIGKGGMGEVWLAEDSRLDRKVAVKVLPTELAADADRRQRFEQEAKAAAALNHPNIAAIHDVGIETCEGTPVHYMVQEYLQGETLREVISRGPLPLEKTRTLAVEIGEAIKAAHRAGIVHRDLKPDNVFVTRDGHAKVLDFGLAKLTEFALPSGAGPSMSPTMTMAGQMLGTAGYMSPEQVRGEEVDERADLFAFGCVLYEMIAGKQAFGGDNVHDSLSRILSGEPERIAQPSGSNLQLGWILDKLLAKDRDRRYQSAADVVVDLQRLDADERTGSTAGAATSVPVAAAPARRFVPIDRGRRRGIDTRQWRRRGSSSRRPMKWLLRPTCGSKSCSLKAGISRPTTTAWSRSHPIRVRSPTCPRDSGCVPWTGQSRGRSRTRASRARPRSLTTAGRSPSGTAATSSARRSKAACRSSWRRSTSGRWACTGPVTISSMWVGPIVGSGGCRPRAASSSRCWS